MKWPESLQKHQKNPKKTETENLKWSEAQFFLIKIPKAMKGVWDKSENRWGYKKNVK